MLPPWHFENDDLSIRKVCVGPVENNVYVVVCRRTREAVIIDAAAEADRILAATADVEPRAIVTTHGHWDHVGAAGLALHLDIPFLIGEEDLEDSGVAHAAPLEARVAFGDVVLDVVPTPGHTPGSTCFATPGVVFTGDTLFPGGPGATGGSPARFEQIVESIERRLFSLRDDTLVFPGHGLDTTIGAERPHLAEWRARGW